MTCTQFFKCQHCGLLVRTEKVILSEHQHFSEQLYNIFKFYSTRIEYHICCTGVYGKVQLTAISPQEND